MEKEARRDFDAAAVGWDEVPRRVQLARDVVDAIRREVPLGTGMNVLDYGCGTGLVTLGLQPLVGHITGADSSLGMLEVLQRKIKERGITNAGTSFMDLEQQGELEQRYDVIVSSMAMHHVGDVGALIGALVQGLNPGGWLALADLEAEDGSFHDDPVGVLHHGFDREFFRAELVRHGLSGVRVVTAVVIEKVRPAGTRRYPVLLCVGRKEV